MKSTEFRNTWMNSIIWGLAAAIAIGLCSAQGQAQSIRYVDDDAPPGGNGMSWATAFRSLQDALDAASQPGSGINEIRIGPGVYVPTNRLDPDDPRSVTFKLKNSLAIRGGYAGLGAPDPDMRDAVLFETILSGDIEGDDVGHFENNSENAYHVVWGTNVPGSAVLDGVVVSGGNANVDDGATGHRNFGGGILVDPGAPTLLNCTFRGNFALSGGAIYKRNSGTLTINSCTFERNRAINGGAIRIFNASQSVHNSQFRWNEAQRHASIAHQDGAHFTLANCVFSENVANTINVTTTGDTVHIANCVFEHNAGGLIINESATSYIGNVIFKYNHDAVGAGAKINANQTGTVENCDFLENFSDLVGGALLLSGNFNVRNCSFDSNTAGWFGAAVVSLEQANLVNCTFRMNESPSGGAVWTTGPLNLINCSLSGNTGGAIALVQTTLGAPALVQASNCIMWGSSPSHFAVDSLSSFDPPAPIVHSSCIQGGWSGLGSNNISDNPLFVQPGCGNLRLSHDSPCINAGNNSFVPADVLTDLDGNPRIIDGIVDMGAYEGGHDPLPQTACAESVGPEEEVRLTPAGSAFNPFNASAIYFYNTTYDQTAIVSVTELDQVNLPQNTEIQPIAEPLEFQSSLADGLYFARVYVHFTAADLDGLLPSQIRVFSVDLKTGKTLLAVAGNTQDSPGHKGPIGNEIYTEGTLPNVGVTGNLGDFGVRWNPVQQRGFAWANVDYAAVFAAGVPEELPCLGDIAQPQDSTVNVTDLQSLLAAWGPAAPGLAADLNEDSVVNVDDLVILLQEWGECS